MCMGGGSVAPPPPKTLSQMQAATDNPYENPGSGSATPQWKLAAKEAEPKDKKETKESQGKKRSDLYG